MTGNHRGIAARAAVVGAAALLVGAGMSLPAAAAPPSGHGSEQSVPQGQRGRLLSSTPLTTAAALPSAASNQAVTYVSGGRGASGSSCPATVSLPSTPPPPGGWPVLSWAHGTTGTADPCAPSQVTPQASTYGYLSGVNETLDDWVAAGYVVVQTDYEGLGTPGGHPYLNGRSAANTVADIVRAARDLDHRVGKDYVVAGHSQGGHAALFAADDLDRRHDVRLLGAVAIAPGGYDVGTATGYYRQLSSFPREAAVATLAFLPTLLLGAEAADASIDADALINDAAQPLIDAGRTGCLAEIRAVAETVPQADPFVAEADLSAFTAYLEAQEPEHLTPQVPTLVAQGTTDALVREPTTATMVDGYCDHGSAISYHVYGGADHRATVPASFEDALAFADALFAGETPAATC
ncbi:alpha/beta hydrolase [Geodermatophilus chilensis]|uniref:alpha/beta hydrolase n=1 Tax=Geodermatophilus chilensis TaxID=2035835 RepID=UPI0018E3FEBD|nr:lipase family protein [Geodermatophilus chilensis]